MGVDKLDNLKMKTIAEDDFEPIWDYFLENCGEDDGFMDFGERFDVTGKPVQTAILMAAAMVFATSGMVPDKTAPAPEIRSIYLRDEKFIHGAVIIQRLPGAFYYFEDLDVGLLCMSMPDNTVFSRISVRPDRGRNPHKR